MSSLSRLVMLGVVLVLACVIVVAYGAEVFQGRVAATTSRHELATLLNASGRSVDSNANGIIDAADDCGSCSSGGGGAPQVITINGAWGGGYIDAGNNALLQGATLPLQVLPSARMTHVRVRKVCSRFVLGPGAGPCSTATGYESNAEVVRINIDWAQRTIKGTAQGLGNVGGLSVLHWDVTNAQSNTYYSGQPCPGAQQCGLIQVDFATRTIKTLPIGTQSLGNACGFIAVVSSYG